MPPALAHRGPDRAGLPLFQIANWHDTFEGVIKRFYGKHINKRDTALDRARAIMPQRVVVPLARVAA